MQPRTLLTTIASHLLPLAAIMSLVLSLPSHADKKGEGLMKQAYDHPSRGGSLGRFKMILKDKAGGERTRTFYSFSHREKGNFVSLIRFVNPDNVKNTGLLTMDRPGDSGDQWLYMPALGKSRRIASNRKGGRFVGSDVFFEDLRDREVELDEHRYLREETMGGSKVAVIESRPRNAGNSFYSKRLVWVHQDIKIPLKIEFYKGKRKEPIKRLEVKKLEQIDGVWTATHNIMSDIQNGSTTALIAEKIQYDNKIPKSLFTVRSLEEPSQDEKLRSRVR